MTRPAETVSSQEALTGDGRSRPLVSVLVPSRNGAQRLPTLLSRLESQTLDREQFEVVVVDDASTDGTPQVVRESPVCRLISPPEPLGVPRASNLAVASSRGSLLAFTDDDVVPSLDWLERGVEALRAQPEGTMLAGHVELTVSQPPTLAELLDIGRNYLDQEHYATAAGMAATANMWIARAWFERAGGFDVRLTAQSHDTDFGGRVRAVGGRVVYAPSVRVSHPSRRTLREVARKEQRLAIGDAELHYLRSPGVETPIFWRLPGYYRPWLTVRGGEHIQRRGHRTDGLHGARLIAAHYAFVQLPAIVGSVKGTMQWRSARRRRGAQG